MNGPRRFHPSQLTSTELPILLEKLDERISEEPLLQEAHTMFNALKEVARLIEDEPRMISYDLQRIFAWSVFLERDPRARFNPDIPAPQELMRELGEIVDRAQDPNYPLVLSPGDVQTYADAHVRLSSLIQSRVADR